MTDGPPKRLLVLSTDGEKQSLVTDRQFGDDDVVEERLNDHGEV